MQGSDTEKKSVGDFCYKYFLPSLLSLGVALIIFYMQIFSAKEDRAVDEKVDKVNAYQASLSGVIFDLEARKIAACSSLDISKEEIVKNSIIIRRQIEILERQADAIANKKEYVYNEKLGEIENNIRKNLIMLEKAKTAMTGFEALSGIDQYRDLTVKGKLAALYVENGEFSETVDLVDDLYAQVAQYRLNSGQEICKKGTSEYTSYEKTIKSFSSALSKVNEIKKELYY